MKRFCLLSVMVSALAVNGFAMVALTYPDSAQYSVGTGSLSANIVLDFDCSNSFVFEYRWSDGQTPTGWDALLALSEQPGQMQVIYTPYPWGPWITDFIYPGGVKYDYSSDNTGWVYYLSNDGFNWTGSGVGTVERLLTDGCWDSWVWSNYDANWSMPYRQPGQMPTPEPATLIMLAFGAGLLARKRA